MRSLPPLFATLLALVLLCGQARAATLPEDNGGAVVLAYFQVSDEASPDSSVTVEQFRTHLLELKAAGANVASLDTILDAWATDKPLPPKTVALTFEGASLSTIQTALPLLREMKYPYTLFVAPGQVGRNDGRFAGWDDVSDVAEDPLATIGLLPMTYQSFGEDSQASFWKAINTAKALFREKTGKSPRYLAFPYGLPPKNFDGDLASQAFAAGFGLQSGVASKSAERWLLPRFTMTGSLGDEDRIRLLLQAAPLPVLEAQPLSGALATNPPAIGFTLPAGLADKVKQLACTSSDGQKAKVSILAKSHVELRFPNPIRADRVRVNCTLTDSADDNGEPRYRWLGFLYGLDGHDEGPADTASSATDFDGQGLEP